MNKNAFFTLIFSCFLPFSLLKAQCFNGKTPSGENCGGTIQTAVPFLRISPDARSGGMGDAGIALSPDANAIAFNVSKLAFAERKWGFASTYTPWLRNLGVNDITLFYGAGYWQFGEEKKQAVSFAYRRFDLGSIQWSDFNAQPIGEGKPHEYEISAAYVQQLSSKWAIGGTLKYIYSNLTTGQRPFGGGPAISSGKAIAMDISTTFKTLINMNEVKSDLTIGAVVSNIGNKITYLQRADFLPTNLGIGAAWAVNFDKNYRFVITTDVNKLLVPTPTPNDSTWLNKGVIEGILGSFSDAPGGFSEELKEINIASGIEIWIKNYVAIRGGYFYESKEKGGRHYMTVGLGGRYKFLGLNLSYLVPTSDQRGPLDNTWRLSLLLNASN